MELKKAIRNRVLITSIVSDAVPPFERNEGFIFFSSL